jgi:hypothetical protein
MNQQICVEDLRSIREAASEIAADIDFMVLRDRTPAIEQMEAWCRRLWEIERRVEGFAVDDDVFGFASADDE